MDELIENVNETRRICKALLSQGLLSEDKFRTITAAPSSQERMRQLLNALASKGQEGRNVLYRLLQEHEPELTLQLGMLHTIANCSHCISLVSILMVFLRTFFSYLAINHSTHHTCPNTAQKKSWKKLTKPGYKAIFKVVDSTHLQSDR